MVAVAVVAGCCRAGLESRSAECSSGSRGGPALDTPRVGYHDQAWRLLQCEDAWFVRQLNKRVVCTVSFAGVLYDGQQL